MASEQNHYKVLGKNVMKITNMLLNNQNLCKLLVYTTLTPLSGPTITDPESLMNKNIRLVPKVPDELTEKGSFVVVLLDSDDINEDNERTTIVDLRFDIICPMDEWLINEESLRPFMIASEIHEMLDGTRVQGIGKLRCLGMKRIVMSDVYAGYSMRFTNHEFNW